MVRKKPQKNKKIEIVFDPKKRREYLTGFRKRKQERRKKAKEELEIQVKEERRRVKDEYKTNFRDKFKKSFAPIPELQDSGDDDDDDSSAAEREIDQEYETEDVSVKIIELSTSELAEQNNWIGENRPTYFNKQDDNDDDDGKLNLQNGNIKNDLSDSYKIPGMDIISKVKQLKPISEKIYDKPTSGAKPLLDIIKKNIPRHIAEINKTEFTSKKQLGKLVEKKTLKSLKHSKVFQIKNKLDRLRDKKKARQVRDQRTKLQKRKKPDKKGGKRQRRGGNEREHGSGGGKSDNKKNKKGKRH